MIKLDIDSDEGMYETLKRVRFANYLFPKMKLSFDKVYPTVKGWHCYLDDEQILKPLDLVMWQLLLGSDAYRELQNVQRILNSVPKWSILFTSRENRKKNYAELFNLYLTMKVL